MAAAKARGRTGRKGTLRLAERRVWHVCGMYVACMWRADYVRTCGLRADSSVPIKHSSLVIVVFASHSPLTRIVYEPDISQPGERGGGDGGNGGDGGRGGGAGGSGGGGGDACVQMHAGYV